MSAAGETAAGGGEYPGRPQAASGHRHPDGHRRIAAAFAGHDRSAALMPYLMGGFPDLEASRAAGLACADAGADLIELGIPFSDPLADGPVIHAAATEALGAGVTPDDVLGVCESVAARVPVVLMVYANAVEAAGREAFVARAAASGAAGLIVPDLPNDEAGELRAACDAGGLALVPLAAPTTPAERLERIAADARGFVYTVSLSGTTGERERLPEDLSDTVARVRAVASVPVAVGFGVSTPEQAALVAELADGVIVGSRVVRAAGEGGPEAVGDLVEQLAAALT
ncbi:MAG: tryptophan synthase subunit alpha, partial [Thermoleophilaceae bacterium]